jgi:lipopolysaccharide export system protein LptA
VNNLMVNSCKRYSYSAIFLAVLWFLASPGQTAVADDPVHIVSDSLEAYQQQQKVIFIGHVVARQGELTIRGDRMTVFYLKQENPKSNEGSLVGKIDRVVVDGNVHITKKKVVASGEHVVYFSEENKVVLTGKSRVERGKDFIQGDKITLFLDSEKSVVEGGPSGPVEATIYSSTSGGLVDKAGSSAK